MKLPKLFTIKEVARLLGVTSGRTVERYVERGWLGSPLEFGTRKRWTEDQVKACVDRAMAGEFKPKKSVPQKVTDQDKPGRSVDK